MRKSSSARKRKSGGTSVAPADLILRGTLFDPAVMPQYVPLQFFNEYQQQQEALRTFLSATRTIELVVPVRPEEAALPLVSLIVWAKAASIRNLGTPLKVKVQLAFCGRQEFDQFDRRDRLHQVWKTLGLPTQVLDFRQLVDDVERDPEIGPVAHQVYKKLVQGVQPDKRELLLQAVTLVAFCSLHQSRFLLCGQDKAPLYNPLWGQELRFRKGEAREAPIALYTPLMPFGEQHPLATDSEDELRIKLATSLSTFRGRDEQLRWARDLVALTKGTWPAPSNGTAPEQGADLAGLSNTLTTDLFQWMARVCGKGEAAQSDQEGQPRRKPRTRKLIKN